MSLVFRLTRPIALAALAVATVACSSMASSDAEPVPPTTLRGEYVYSDGAHVMHPCGNASMLWVVGDEDLLEPLRTRSAARSKALGKPDQSVYVELTGTLEPSTMAGYGNTLQVTTATLLGDQAPATCPSSLPSAG
ncbi:hypothetical protein [Marilutibacter chinensis]|uniref:NlpE-like protein n=1 Tax=Marilutibacter chinensis TaxID=2912247 RepID=A0ABS9I098_9GAMM|nr:hypothetical protein [Lysobacter chinensis]MCF7223804.1 hypothetical protein [Lysobacter chinensis]